jgi:3-methyladenine DNA glycosylase AlkD
MAPSVTALVDEIVALLVSAGTPGRAEQERRYLKSDLYFLGASHWETGKIARTIAKREGLDHDATVALATGLWAPPVFERRAAAVAILEARATQLGADDLPLLERLLRESRTWALVDGLAANVVGGIALREPDAVRPTLDRWAGDADFWMRRSSLLAELLPLKSGAPFEPFAVRADLMLSETEFFIRKAIGWVLREAGKRRPDQVVAWLTPRATEASGVTMREAVKYLPSEDSARLMALYRARARGSRAAGPGRGPSVRSPAGPRTRRTHGRG